MTRSIDPASRDYTRARHRLPREQREVWGAPVRDGTCADEGDESCEACDCAPPPPPLVEGGQGRSDEATMAAGEIVGWVVGIMFLLAAVGVALSAWGVL